MRTGAERTVEALTWAAVVMWLGFVIMLNLLSYLFLVMMVLGIILLSSAFYQRSQGWHTSLAIWITGIWMAVFSLLEIMFEMVNVLTGGEGLHIDLYVYFGVALMSMGLAVVFRTIRFGGLLGGGSQTSVNSRQDRALQVPRRVEQDQTASYRTSASYSSRSQQTRGQSRGQAPVRSNADTYQATDYETTSEPPRAVRRAQPRTPTQRARPAAEPENLESRVEDIIRRSRERRDKDNLPY